MAVGHAQVYLNRDDTNGDEQLDWIGKDDGVELCGKGVYAEAYSPSWSQRPGRLLLCDAFFEDDALIDDIAAPPYPKGGADIYQWHWAVGILIQKALHMIQGPSSRGKSYPSLSYARTTSLWGPRSLPEAPR